VTTLRACEAGGFSFDRAGEHAVVRVSQSVEGCADCSGTGLLRSTVQEFGRSYEVTTPCPRKRMEKRAEAFNQARLPAVHANSTLDNFKGHREEVARAFEVARNFVFKWPSERGFIISGPVGTGKTHLLTATLRYLSLELGVRTAYTEISLLFSTIRRGFQKNLSGGDIIQPLADVEVLAIDELGKGRGTPFELDTLDELISRRYNAGRVTLFATNYSLREAEMRAPGMIRTEDLQAGALESKWLVDRVGARIYSRLCEMCEFVEFSSSAGDFRRARNSIQRRP
jgi:DNA replication protein DnaC